MTFLSRKPKAQPCSNLKLDIAEILLYPLITWTTDNNPSFWWVGQPLVLFVCLLFRLTLVLSGSAGAFGTHLVQSDSVYLVFISQTLT